jgi:hypothetical protein
MRYDKLAMAGIRLIDNRAKVLVAYDKGSQAGLIAAGNMLVRELKFAHTEANYYKGGAFRNTLGVRASIRRTNPEKIGGAYQMRVGTKFIEALYWELGHYNVFTREYEPPVRIWMPTFLEKREQARALWAKTVNRFVGRIR